MKKKTHNKVSGTDGWFIQEKLSFQRDLDKSDRITKTFSQGNDRHWEIDQVQWKEFKKAS